MNIENYIKKKKLFGMKDCYIDTTAMRRDIGADISLERAYIYDNEVLYIANIKHGCTDKHIAVKYIGDKKFMDYCQGYLYQYKEHKTGTKLLNKMVIAQRIEDFNSWQLHIKVVIAEFNNGNTIAIKYNSDYNFEMIETDKFGYCIAIIENKQTYFELVMIDNKLNRYLCKVEQPSQEYKLYDKIEKDEFKFRILNGYKVRIGKVVEKLDKLDKDYVEDAEIYEV